jgi:hypothetical protein
VSRACRVVRRHAVVCGVFRDKMATTLEDEVFGSLGLLKLDELLNIYDDLGLPAITEEDAHRVVAVVRRRIMKFLTSDTVENSDDQGCAHFLAIKTFLDTQDIRVSRSDDDAAVLAATTIGDAGIGAPHAPGGVGVKIETNSEERASCSGSRREGGSREGAVVWDVVGVCGIDQVSEEGLQNQRDDS